MSGSRKRAQVVAAAIAAFGMACALAIYLTAGETPENPLADQLDNSKAYQRSLEIYGGQANLLTAQFNRWFQSLWHGKTLSFTVAVIAVLVAALYYFIASPIPPEE